MGQRYRTAIESFFDAVILLETDESEGNIDEAGVTEAIGSVKPLTAINNILDRWSPEKGDLFNYLDAIQVNRLINWRRSEIKSACVYPRFRKTKHDVNEMLPLLDRTRYEVRTRVRNRQLVVDFPDWNDASNGEIDVLQLCVALFRARIRLGVKKSPLLIIDEVFDYLDDANLLVAQHLLLEMMKQFRDSERRLYVVILTHLDPGLFNSFRFRNFHTSYISIAEEGFKQGRLNKILIDRTSCQKERKDIFEAISSHYLHFSGCRSVSEDVLTYVSK